PRGFGSVFRKRNQRKGSRKTSPINRPSRRCRYSSQKMPLKPSRVSSPKTFLDCGVSRYLSKSAFQSESESGGTMPETGCHSVIESPDSVRRVIPPTTTTAKVRAAQTSSHAATLRRSDGFILPRRYG